MAKPSVFLLTSAFLLVLAASIFQQSQANVEVSVLANGIKLSTSNNDGGSNPISSTSTTLMTKTSLTNIEIAVYVISCLAVFLVTICCFYCCKHFCCEGCRGEATVTYQQMGPTPLNTGSIRVPASESSIPPPTNQRDAQIDMIPLQGIKRVTFASVSNLNYSASPKDSLPPPYRYENFP